MRKCLIFVLLFWLCTACGSTAQAQDYTLKKTFTTSEGLASNHIYDIEEDKEGFLWIATDNGISRFDGKFFQNFSVKDGLPSNDVLAIVKEADGTLWVNCFKQLPAYFDQVNNRFISIQTDSILTGISQSLLVGYAIPKGGVRFNNSKGEAIFKNKKVVYSTVNSENTATQLTTVGKEDYYVVSYPLTNGKQVSFSIRYVIKNEKRIDSFLLKEKGLNRAWINFDNQIYSSANSNKFWRFTLTAVKPIRYQLDSVVVPEYINRIKALDNQVLAICKSGAIYCYDKKNLRLKHKIASEFATNPLI